jgi:dipeptidyl aminopeptidase/acylaminoacyl peptidase
MAYASSPAWSPDGTKLAFASFRPGNYDVYVMNADGSGQTRLTADPGHEGAPDWSPDGSMIAFFSNREGRANIYVMDADGGRQRQLTADPVGATTPAWSPDGTKIAFAGFRDGNGEIYVIDADGTNETRLTANAALDFAPDWQPLAQNGCGEVRGDGRLDTNALTRFVFYQVKSDGSSAPSGEISFSDRTTSPRLHFESTAIRTLVITASHVRLTGSGVADGQPVDFVVDGDDGTPDRVSIRLSSGYSAGRRRRRARSEHQAVLISAEARTGPCAPGRRRSSGQADADPVARPPRKPASGSRRAGRGDRRRSRPDP